MPKGYVSFDSGVLLVHVSVEVLHDGGAAVAAATARVGAASTHTPVLSDQMPKGDVSFDSGRLLQTTVLCVSGGNGYCCRFL